MCILMVAVLAALLCVTLFGKALLSTGPVDASAEPAGTLRLRQGGGRTTVYRCRHCLGHPDPEGIRPEPELFFLRSIPANRVDDRMLETSSGIGPHLASETVWVRDQENGLLWVPGTGRKQIRQLGSQFPFAQFR